MLQVVRGALDGKMRRTRSRLQEGPRRFRDVMARFEANGMRSAADGYDANRSRVSLRKCAANIRSATVM